MPGIRLLEESDSLQELTALLHRAYAALAAQGFRYRATNQDVETTRRRISHGQCYLMVEGAQLLGTILLIPPSAKAPYCAYYDRDDVAVLSQFAVEPPLQGRGLGRALMDFAEARARELGAREVAVDTAENATHLVDYYLRRRYRFIQHAQWEHTNYRSAILSKTL